MRGHKRGKLLLCAALLAVSSLSLRPSAAAPGDIDSAFGVAGKATTNLGVSGGTSWGDRAQGAVVQLDGKIVVAGSTDKASSSSDIATVRYTANGALDTTFGSGGIARADFGGADYGAAIVRQADGKLVVAGGTESSIALVRYTTSGGLDNMFGSGGKVTTAVSGYAVFAYAVLVQPDGKIVAAGTADDGTSSSILAARYNTNGNLDATFGTGGIVKTPIAGMNANAYAVAQDASGRIVVAGAIDTDNSADFALLRYTTTGALDATFGSGGKVTTSFSAGFDYGYALAVQADGKILAAGTAQAGTGSTFGLARYTGSGAPDSTFGSGGKVSTSFSSLFGGSTSTAAAGGIVLQGDRIVVGGEAGPSGGSERFALARYQSDGSLEPLFGTGGRLVTTIGGVDDEANAIAAQPDGKIVAAGFAFMPATSSTDFAVIRYQTTYPSGADLRISETGPATPVPVGGDLTFGVTVRNDGPQAASLAKVTDVLPPGVTLKSATPSQGSCSLAAGTITCDLVTLNYLAVATVSIVLTPQAGGTIKNTVSASSSLSDPYGANNSAAASGKGVVTAGPPFKKQVAGKTIEPDPAGYGAASASSSANEVTGGVAASASASDTLPAGVSVNGTTYGISHAAANARVVGDQLAVTGTAPLTVTITLSNIQGSRSAGADVASVNGVRSGAASVVLKTTVWLYPCASTSACSPVTSATASVTLGLPGPATRTVTATLVPPGSFTTGILLIDAGLFADALVYGAAHASVTASGTVSQVTAQ
jgi:uncharacterized delta-60 repeat protein/uncharacterized repeat protein (TIGR01451 family)